MYCNHSRKVFHIKDYASDTSNSAIKLSRSPYENNDWLAELSSSGYVMAIATHEDDFVYSHDDFQEIKYQEVEFCQIYSFKIYFELFVCNVH